MEGLYHVSLVCSNSTNDCVTHPFVLQDVTLAALYVPSKIHDTVKKPRDLLMVSYVVKYPEPAAKVGRAAGEVGMDPVVRSPSLFHSVSRLLDLIISRV